MITHVAIRYRGKIYSLPSPNRHHHVIWKIVEETGEDHIGSNEQGFLDELGYFLDREMALRHALANNQVKDESKIRCAQLFSEDLW